jgi:hypothetical protein
LICWKVTFGHRKGFGKFRMFFGVPGGYRNPPGNCWANMGRRRGGRQPTRGVRVPLPWGVRIGLGEGARPPFLLLFPLPSPFPLRKKGKGGRIGLGVLFGFPPWRAPPRPALSPLLLYIRGQGAPQSTTDILLAVCDAPSTVYSSGHSVVVLRRSPARITSPSPSPHRRADETLP